MEYVAIGLLAVILLVGVAVFLTTVQAREIARESRELNQRVLDKLAGLETKIKADNPDGGKPDDARQASNE
jgi:hypothetical protein